MRVVNATAGPLRAVTVRSAEVETTDLTIAPGESRVVPVGDRARISLSAARVDGSKIAAETGFSGEDVVDCTITVTEGGGGPSFGLRPFWQRRVRRQVREWLVDLPF